MIFNMWYIIIYGNEFMIIIISYIGNRNNVRLFMQLTKFYKYVSEAFLIILKKIF